MTPEDFNLFWSKLKVFILKHLVLIYEEIKKLRYHELRPLQRYFNRERPKDDSTCKYSDFQFYFFIGMTIEYRVDIIAWKGVKIAATVKLQDFKILIEKLLNVKKVPPELK